MNCRDKVLRLLRKHPQGLITAEIIRHLDENKNSVSSAIRCLARDGLIEVENNYRRWSVVQGMEVE